jgi:Pyruvate/2-oxoacid:ferredoxin oxidoreductase gamma subunit
VAPQESIDLLVALDSATVEIHRTELSPRGIILIDSDLSTPEECCRKVPFKELAPERYANITALGVVGTLLGLREEIVVRAADDFFGHKSPEAAEGNRRALQAALPGRKTVHRLPSCRSQSLHLEAVLTRNEARPWGAVRGLKIFCLLS